MEQIFMERLQKLMNKNTKLFARWNDNDPIVYTSNIEYASSLTQEPHWLKVNKSIKNTTTYLHQKSKREPAPIKASSFVNTVLQTSAPISGAELLVARET